MKRTCSQALQMLSRMALVLRMPIKTVSHRVAGKAPRTLGPVRLHALVTTTLCELTGAMVIASAVPPYQGRAVSTVTRD